MKKNDILIAQPVKTETGNPALQIQPITGQKMYRDHKVCDHYTHGRVNKFPFGSSQGPVCF
ncbi:hypothetical protein HQ865_03425 [Mucilaginibacter mali]|uniref:Uncharacterized protein n=1 Tax=Mucilaginibacter mali TaxID=2740462 RepID=A0A7D4PS94_9SPHI|nr:hypothetical protein [Mucilaginibacter mali]QKJ28843.1 hypothetical protein HQ865_03425 [Mucilaginibacter mali]